MSAMASRLSASRLSVQPFVQAQIKENIKAPRHLPLRIGIHRWPMNSPHKGPVTRKIFPFDDVIMQTRPAGTSPVALLITKMISWNLGHGQVIHHGPRLLTWILILAWIDNHLHGKVLNEITHPFPKFNGCTVEVYEWISNFINYFGCNHSPIPNIKGF